MAPPRPIPRSDSIDAIGARLRLIRIAYGRAQGRTREISQSEFARLCDVGVAAWNNAETGDNRIGVDNAMGIVRHTGVTLDYIYLGARGGLPHVLAVEIEKLEQEEAEAAAEAKSRKARRA